MDLNDPELSIKEKKEIVLGDAKKLLAEIRKQQKEQGKILKEQQALVEQLNKHHEMHENAEKEKIKKSVADGGTEGLVAQGNNVKNELVKNVEAEKGVGQKDGVKNDFGNTATIGRNSEAKKAKNLSIVDGEKKTDVILENQNNFQYAPKVEAKRALPGNTVPEPAKPNRKEEQDLVIKAVDEKRSKVQPFGKLERRNVTVGMPKDVKPTVSEGVLPPKKLLNSSVKIEA